jgi:ATP-dependent Clp protease ATP-binding subunit ClpB
MCRPRNAVMAAVRDAFRPEFLNRLDEMLLFRRLSREDMKGIVAIQLEHLKKLLADRKITLEVDAAASAWLANAGYDPVYGARPLKRVIQRELQNRWPSKSSRAASPTARQSMSAPATGAW